MNPNSNLYCAKSPRTILMRKFFIFLALTAAALLAAQTAFGQVTYTYTGKPFSLFSCGGNSLCSTPGPNANTSYSATDIVTGTLTLASALPGGLSLADISGYAGFKIALNDGHQTMTAMAGYIGGFRAQISTDAGGNITEWVFVVNCCFNPNNGVATAYAPDYPGGSSIFDQAVLSAPSPNNGYPNTPLNMAYNSNKPGTWSAGGGTGGTGGSFPTGTFVRLTQNTICCGGVVVDNDDVISGGLNQTPTWGGAGSQLGANWATASDKPVVLDATTNPPVTTNNGPSVGAYSDSNQGTGFGRAIAFATFTNNSSTTQLRAHADLSGEFIQGPFGLPNGILAAGAAIHVFDTAKFNAAISAATDGTDAAIGKFLLNGYSATAGLVPSAGIGNLDLVLASARIGGDTKYYSNGPFNPPAPVSAVLNAAFTIPIGKNYTVMFDVVASGVVEGTPGWGIGTGQVNFADTLKPSATFFTDANGNPVSGIGVVGALPSLPAGPAAVALAPLTGQLAMEHPYTVTATVSDSSSKPVAGASVKFTVTNGPDTGVSGVSISDANGNANFTYTGQGGAGTDTIQASVGAILSNTAQVTWQSAKCPQLQGFWKNNPTAWPVTSLTLGSQTYSQAELRTILNNPGGGDASMILAVQLIASKLDIANGSNPTPIRSAGATADLLLNGFAGKLPYNVRPNSATGQSMTQVGGTLQSYTSGQLTPGCTP